MAVTSHDPLVLNSAVFKSLHTTQLTQRWTQGNTFAAAEVAAAPWSRDGVFHVPGIGEDIWGTQDDFEFVHRTGRGDSEIVARVVQLENTSAFAKAGVMVRADSSDSSAHVILDVKPDGGVEFMTRSSSGAQTSFIAGGSTAIPVWLRLVRHGDQVDGYMSNDGSSWVLVGTATLTLPAPDYNVGLAATSHDPDEVNDTIFDNVSVSGLRQQYDGPNLIQNGTFEEYSPGPVGAPWVSDRDVPAIVETAHPHSGAKNAACRATSTGDCGVYQEITLPQPGNYLVRFFVNAEGPGVIVGLDINGQSLPGGPVDILEPGNYEAFGWGITLRPGDNLTIRVWLYAPAGSGGAVIDEVSVTAYSGPT
jgi:regulation of enolase protein 1 (concanavalin A-like superfamily)